MTDSRKPLEQKIADLEREREQLKEQLKKVDNDTIKKLEVQLELDRNLLSIEEKKLEIKNKHLEATEDDYKIIVKAKEALRETTKELHLQKEAMIEISSFAKSFASDISESLGIMKDLNETTMGKLVSKVFVTKNYMAAMNKSAEELSKNLGKRILVSVAEKGQEMIVGLVTALDSARASMAKTIPLGHLYTGMVEKIASGNHVAFASFDDVAKSIEGLNENYTEFNRIAPDQQEKLVELATNLEHLGVSTETFGQNLDITTKAMGFSKDEFVNLQGEMFAWSKKLGINMGKLNKDFQAAAPRLAQFSKTKAVQVFKEMTNASKNLGIEMNKMLDITANFDTFEGAAEAAGSLNSVLGGNVINTLDLMNAALDNPIEVFKQFKGALDKTGKSFDSMTPAMKKTIAEMMKMDVSEVERLSNQDLSTSIEQLQGEADSMEEMQKAAAKAIPVGEKLQKIFYKFAVFISPAVDALESFVNWLGKIAASPVGKWIGGITMGVGVLGSALVAISGAVVGFLAILKLFGATVAGTVGVVAEGAAVGITKIGKAAAASATGILTLAAAVVLVGAGVGLAAYGVSLLVKSFQGFDVDQIYAITFALGVFMLGITAMVAGISAIGEIAIIAGLALLPLGAAFMMIGEGVNLAATGVAELVRSFGDLSIVKLQQINQQMSAIADSFERVNSSLTNTALGSKAVNAVEGAANSMSIQMPAETIPIQITSTIILDGVKMGDFVQEQIVKREGRMLPGKLQTSTGIKTGR